MSVVRDKKPINLLTKVAINATHRVNPSLRELKDRDNKDPAMICTNDLTMRNKTPLIVSLEHKRTCDLLPKTEEIVSIGLSLELLLCDGIHGDEALSLDLLSKVRLKVVLRVELVGFIKYFHVFDLQFYEVGNEKFILFVKEISGVSNDVLNKPSYKNLLIMSNTVNHLKLAVKMQFSVLNYVSHSVFIHW